MRGGDAPDSSKVMLNLITSFSITGQQSTFRHSYLMIYCLNWVAQFTDELLSQIKKKKKKKMKISCWKVGIMVGLREVTYEWFMDYVSR